MTTVKFAMTPANVAAWQQETYPNNVDVLRLSTLAIKLVAEALKADVSLNEDDINIEFNISVNDGWGMTITMPESDVFNIDDVVVELSNIDGFMCSVYHHGGERAYVITPKSGPEVVTSVSNEVPTSEETTSSPPVQPTSTTPPVTPKDDCNKAVVSDVIKYVGYGVATVALVAVGLFTWNHFKK